MEILRKFKENGYFTSDLYHLLAKKKMVNLSEEIIPSQYQKEMRMSCEERLTNLNNIEIDNIVTTGGQKADKPVLEFYPRILIFQNYKPNQRIVAKFSVKNISIAPTYLNMVYKGSSYFFIKPVGAELLHRLAPGISATFAITFIPHLYEDYTHKVTFYTDIDQYVLPLIGMGPRPLFNFPDEIVVPDTPIKVENSTHLSITNIGVLPIGFTLSTKCPFSVNPKSAYLSADTKLELKVSMKTMFLGETDGKILATFETGENFKIAVKGRTYIVSIELEKAAVRFLDTYNTMARQQTYKIINKSDNMLTFSCMKNESVHHDFEEKLKLATKLYDMKESESLKYTKLVRYDIVSSSEHDRVYTRIFYDEIQELVVDETLHFQNMHFSVTPIKGYLWPKNATELTVTFAPKEVGSYQFLFYLDIDGIKERVPIKLVGTSLPPNIHLNCEILDMDQIFINKKYNYEIVAINRGHIHGVVVFKEPSSLFGSRISCTPETHCLEPGGKEIFNISFCNPNQGPYFEEIQFIIRDTKTVLKLYLKGEVVYPSLMFSETCLDFGNVSVGVPKTLTLEVINESVVTVKGTVKIASDGPEISAITLEDVDVCCADIKIPTPQWPREFRIEPEQVEIESESRIIILVTLTANMVRANQTQLELELEKSDSPPIVMPVMFNAMVPEITPAPEINLRACFIEYPYHEEVVLKTKGHRGFFTIEEPREDLTLQVEVATKRGIIECDSTVTLPIIIKTEITGLQEYPLRMSLFGLPTPIEVCNIFACGVKPIVTCAPLSLQWGQLKLLTRSNKTLTLCNDSPVKVHFRNSLLNKDGRWTITPSEGVIKPESELELVVSVCLLDAAIYSNKAVIQLEKVKDILIPLSAIGIGTSIIVGDLKDKVALGLRFSKIPLSSKVTVKNCGTRMHNLEWTHYYKTGKTKLTTAPPSAFLCLEPKIFRLGAGEQIQMTITGSSMKALTIREIWYLVGGVEGLNKKELLMQCLFTAEFVDPKIELSTSQINLQYDYGPYSDFYKLTDILTLKNTSRLPLDIELNIRPPFAIIERRTTYKVPSDETHLCDCITYDENDLNVQTMLKEFHPQQSREWIDCLTHKPLEPLHKGPLKLFQDIHKIKKVFSLTHSVEERLEDQEVMKVQILMDTTKHTTLKCKVYSDVMKIRFKGHKNKDSVKVLGKINFPNIMIVEQKVDFNCILNDSVQSKTFKIQNPTPLLACFTFRWKKCHITTLPMPELPKLEYGLASKTIQSFSTTERTISTPHPDPEPIAESVIEQNIVEPSFSENKENVSILLTQDLKSSLNIVMAKDIGMDPEVMRTKILQKITPMLPPERDTGFPWAYKFPKIEKYRKYDINELFQVTPHRGLMRPGDIQYVHVIFRPTRNVNVRAVLECEVLGGPTETVVVSGQSSDLIFTLNTQKLNFKIRSFHEPAIEQLILTNVAYLPFQYKTYLNEPKFENELQGVIHSVDPPEKVLEPENQTEINVIMRTGVVGFFHRVFILEIGHLPHLPIEVFGWGVIPQIYLSLPRPEMSKLRTEVGYIAIQELTTEYLAAVNEIFDSRNSVSTEHLNSPQIDKCFEDPEFMFEWHICSSWDGYPTLMDIELAIERYLVVNHIKHRPEILTQYSNSAKTGAIPNFVTIPFVIDFGVVITGSTITCMVDIVNYGPISTKLHFMKTTQTFPWLNIKLCGKLMPGETGKLEVAFSPDAESFRELEQNVQTIVNIEVPYGVVLPLQIKALVAVPYLKSNVTKLDLGTVRCGDKIVCSIPLKNVGKPACVWYATLKLKTPGPIPMEILQTSGKYEAEEGGWLTLSFKPTMEMFYEAMLIFRFHMNPTKLTIPVVGTGVMPHVHVIGPNINFPPTLPWAATTEIYFGFTNPCPFPIELIMPHNDDKWNEEEEIYQLLMKYYNKPDEMLVPSIKPGAGLPPEIITFFKTFKETVKQQKDEETAAATKASQYSARTPQVRKEKKSPKNAPKATKEQSPARKYRTEGEIIADVIKSMKEMGTDPLKESLQAMEHEPSVDESAKQKGLILLVHGSPCDENLCSEMAYTVGIHLKLPTVNFDFCITEALCVCTGPTQNLLVNAINEQYETIKKLVTPRQGDSIEGEDDNFHGFSEDEFDIMHKKLEYIAANKNYQPKGKPTDKKNKQLSAAELNTAMTIPPPGSPYLFHIDYIEELLTEYFALEKFSLGFIVDTLTSYIIKLPTLVLTTVLKSKRTIRNIHLVLCHTDFNKWLQEYEEAQREIEAVESTPTKVYTEEAIENIIEEFEEMDADEYDAADPEQKAIYIQYGLEERRKKRLEKLGISPEERSPKKDISTVTLTPATQSDSKKKMTARKEDQKGKVNSEVTSLNQRYNEYVRGTMDGLINIANNWIIDDCEVGVPMYTFNGQVVGVTAKKSKVKKSETQLHISEEELIDRGFPLTFITCPCLDYKTALVDMLKNSPKVEMALKKEEPLNILTCNVDKKEYTLILPKTMPVINHSPPLTWLYLAEKPIKKCECNQITDLNLLDDTIQDNVLSILSKWHCTCGKKLASNQTSTTEIPSVSVERMSPEESGEFHYPLPLQSVKSIPERSSRLVLQPGDLLRCKYTYSPQEEGNYSVKRFVEVFGWPDSKVDINVTGICDLPRLDNRPKKMFEHFVRRTVEGEVYKRTFLDELKLFEFGPIFVGPNRIYEEEDKIDLRNCSLLVDEVEIEFEDPTTVFQFDKNQIRLELGCREKLTVTAAPAVVGVHTSELIICIKDNPEIIRITIACSGVVPDLQILPLTKMIDYGKLLLYRRADDRFIVKNSSILPIMWKVRNPDDFVEHFIISHTTGIVARQENQVIPLTYIACEVGVITNKSLMIDIFDEQGRGDPMIIDVLFLSAECYDVMVECAYENPSENYLNFGNVKVNSTVWKEMYLLNRGKYPVYYKMKKVKNFPDLALLKTFQVEPETGVVPATLKLVSIEYECTPSLNVNLVNVPVYMCSILDSSKDQIVVAKFPICATIASFYNTFTLFPLGELNFHIISVGSGVMRDVILNNTSKCPFVYDIIVPEKYRVPEEELLPAKGGKENKLKRPPKKCGNFIIVNEDNLLAPGTSRTIQIQFMATAPRLFEETVHFIVSDTCPAEADGVPYRLVGMGATPTLDFWNVDTTFRDHIIVRSMVEYKSPQATPHCVYAEDTVTLYFFSVAINTSYKATLDLYNNGVVPSSLNAKLSYQSNTSEKIFSCVKYDVHIDPLMHKNLTLVFSPKELLEYRAVLDLRLKLLNNEEQSFKVCLVGNGMIPRITLLYPEVRQYRLAAMNFPMTSLGSTSVKTIVFKNIAQLKTTVNVNILQSPYEERPIFTMIVVPKNELIVANNVALGPRKQQQSETQLIVVMDTDEIVSINVYFNPLNKGRTSCDIKLTIKDNPYEIFTVMCVAEAFIEDVMLIGLEMLSMEIDMETFRSDATAGGANLSDLGTGDGRKKSKSAPVEKKKKEPKGKSKKVSQTSIKPTSIATENSELKYVLDFGGCELFTMHKRSVIMVNNSEKLYKFKWLTPETIVIKPSIGYISPGEEKDLEMTYFSAQPLVIRKEPVTCYLIGVSSDMVMDITGTTWDNRQTFTQFTKNNELDLLERTVTVIDDQGPPPFDDYLGMITINIYYSAVSEYSKYTTTLEEEVTLQDTFIYQKQSFDFEMTNVGNVPLKVTWHFHIDDEYPARVDRPRASDFKATSMGDSLDGSIRDSVNVEACVAEAMNDSLAPETREGGSKLTLFSGSEGRQSVDTWFEVDLPFKIEPAKECINAHETKAFKVTFAPQDAFDFTVRLRSNIENLDPYDVNVCCKISVRALVPLVHLDMEESDYITSGRRQKITGGVALPPHMHCLEFNVLGTGCYKKTIHIVNPTSEGYEFNVENLYDPKAVSLVPVHCNHLKGYVEGGTSQEIMFTFTPVHPGIYESQWKVHIRTHSLVENLMVVGCVRQPDVEFIPALLVINNTVVGLSTSHKVVLRNNDNDSVTFRFKGDSIINDKGKRPILVEPEMGILKPLSEVVIRIIYAPITDGPTSFKIFFQISHLIKDLTLCVNALSYSIKPQVTYTLIGHEHLLSHTAINNIHFDQTASTYDRTVPFKIKNNGTATCKFTWIYKCANVKKYLQMWVDPAEGSIAPGEDTDCIMHFKLKDVPVKDFPVELAISNGPKYELFLHAEIEKPLYHFSCKYYDFGNCFVNAPDKTYKKNFAFTNDDKEPLTLVLSTTTVSELLIDFRQEPIVEPNERIKIPVYFRPKAVKDYEFRLQFWVNTLCEEIVIVRGTGVPLLFDLYEGCEKSFYLGPVDVGKKVVREICVMNHSKIPVEARFLFRDALPADGFEVETQESRASSMCLEPAPSTAVGHPEVGAVSRAKQSFKYYYDKTHKQQELDCINALASVKVTPEKVVIQPHRRVTLKIHYKPVCIITSLTHIVMSFQVLDFIRPLVLLSGCATGYDLYFNQSSLQFGRVRKCGVKTLKVMLVNNGNYVAKFCFQPLTNDEFTVSPMVGHVSPKSNCLISATFKPLNFNPFIKLWAKCQFDNKFKPLELAMYAACTEGGTPQTMSLFIECPVRSDRTEHIVITNPTDETWNVVSQISAPFETLREFSVSPEQTFKIPITFKPLSIGTHEQTAIFSPLGESALFVHLVGAASHPLPMGTIDISVEAKVSKTVDLKVYHITEKPETYAVATELASVVPGNFSGFYDVKYPETLKVWGGTTGVCRWTYVCYECCEMVCKVMFVNVDTREYQYYIINIKVTPNQIIDTISFVSRARESVQQEIVINNPLPQPSEFNVYCEKLQMSETIIISRNSETRHTLTYSPLVVGETEDYLTISNSLMGTSMYRVVAKCLPAKSKTLEYTTSLGSSIPIRLRVQNKADSRADFIASVTHPSIVLERDYSLNAGEKRKFVVCFEPTELGEQECAVSFNSPVAGEFIYVIKGTATVPQPQGPYDIRPGNFNTIRFKNVFLETRTFRIFVDREDFVVKTAEEIIKSKKDVRINVYLNTAAGRAGDGALPTGCLIVEPLDPPEPNVQWNYFLQGV